MYFKTHKVLLGEKIVEHTGRYTLSSEQPMEFGSIDDMQQSFFVRGAREVSVLWKDTDTDSEDAEHIPGIDETMESIEARNDCMVVRTLTKKSDRIVLQYYVLEICTNDEVD
jgi:hypothetical protein